MRNKSRFRIRQFGFQIFVTKPSGSLRVGKAIGSSSNGMQAKQAIDNIF